MFHLRCMHTPPLTTFTDDQEPREPYLPPVFEPTVSPELDTVLDLLRRKVILPRLLNQQQKKLVNDPTKKEYLLNEEIVVRIGDEDIRLEPHSFSKDGVSTNKTFTKALEIAVEEDEFDFLPEILKGIHSADLNISDGNWHAWDINGRNRIYSAIRSALEAGHIGLVMRILERGSQMGIQLNAVITRLIATSIRNETHLVNQVQLARERIQDPAVQEAVIKSIRAVANGEEFSVENKSVDYLHVRAEALKVGFKQAMHLNRLAAQHQALRSRRSHRLVDDPLLAALPLEFKAELELTEEALKEHDASSAADATTTPEPSDASAEPSPSAEAEADAEPTDSSTTTQTTTTLPKNTPSAYTLTTSLLTALNNHTGPILALTPHPDTPRADFDLQTLVKFNPTKDPKRQAVQRRRLALFRMAQHLAYHERLSILSHALRSALRVGAVAQDGGVASRVEALREKVAAELAELQTTKKAEIEQVHSIAGHLARGYFGHEFQAEKALGLTLQKDRASRILDGEA